MIELPEAVTLAQQINENVAGRRITGVTAGHTPHKLVWYYGEPAKFSGLLAGRTIGEAGACGGMVEIKAEYARILLSDGALIRFHVNSETRPAKHQLLIEFEDNSAISVSVQMYGGIGSYSEGELDNPYYKAAKEKPSPLSPAFDEAYLDRIISAPEVQKLSLKALLATEQRIPGLGNGVLQDILFNAKINPKKQVNTLSDEEKARLYSSVTGTLTMMTGQNGRDTELDLLGRPGGYKTIMCKNSMGKPCPACGTLIKKEAYMGGSIYYCGECQKQ